MTTRHRPRHGRRGAACPSVGTPSSGRIHAHGQTPMRFFSGRTPRSDRREETITSQTLDWGWRDQGPGAPAGSRRRRTCGLAGAPGSSRPRHVARKRESVTASAHCRPPPPPPRGRHETMSQCMGRNRPVWPAGRARAIGAGAVGADQSPTCGARVCTSCGSKARWRGSAAPSAISRRDRSMRGGGREFPPITPAERITRR